MRCYEADDAVTCFVGMAQEVLGQVKSADDRADAVGELLYALAATQTRNDAVLDEASALVRDGAVKPVKQMDLLYAIDLYAGSIDPAAEPTYAAAVRRFADLERELKNDALIELYVGACLIIGWDEPLRERWWDFAQSVCTPDRLRGLKAEGVAHRALLLAMTPVAMSFAGSPEGFAMSADAALSWLHGAEKAAAKSKHGADKDFVAYIAVLMHTMNSFCLDEFDQPEASDAEVERARKALRRMEARIGISGKSTVLRRQVIEAMFDTGREPEAKKMLRQMLSRIDADKAGRKIPYSEQVAVLLLAAKLAHEEQSDQEQTCVPDGQVKM